MEQNKNVLVCGASFAGLTMAYRMSKMGYHVTVIEIGSHLKMGGTPVDIKDQTMNIIKEMGLYEKVKAHRIGPEKWEFKNASDVSEHTVVLEKSNHEFEIERDLLLNMLFDLVKDEVYFIFNSTITVLEETPNGIQVTITGGAVYDFELVFGCDGIHSAVRRIWFGEETEYVRSLGPYFCIAIAHRLLVERGTYQLYAEPNRGLALYAYNNKTDIIFTFRPEHEIFYDFRNQEQMKTIVSTYLEGMSWRL